MTPIADFRSDTVTRPTPEMRRAMAEAEVGDDVFGEDPTVNQLEARAAEILGKESALFVPSGTMGNQTAIKAHTQPGQEIICDDRSHVILYEMGMPAMFSGCLIRGVPTTEGILSWSDVSAAGIMPVAASRKPVMATLRRAIFRLPVRCAIRSEAQPPTRSPTTPASNGRLA